MAQAVRGAVETGEYASSSPAARTCARPCATGATSALHAQELSDLRATIQQGLDNIEAGRVRDFDAKRFIEQGQSARGLFPGCLVR